MGPTPATPATPAHRTPPLLRVQVRPQPIERARPGPATRPQPTVRPRPRPRPKLTCRQALKAAKARFRTWKSRPRRKRGGLVCQVVDPVILVRGPSGLRFGSPRINCELARRLLRFEKILQREAKRAFGEPVKRLIMWSSYRCGYIAGAGTLASEHSFGNAVDLAGVVLKSGKRTTVKRHYPKTGNGKTKRGQFWVRLSKRLYKDKVFTVVLTPRFNRIHHDHLHLDAASYTTDGT